MIVIKYILTILAGLFLAAVVVWIFRHCWDDMVKLLNSLDEPDPDENEKAD